MTLDDYLHDLERPTTVTSSCQAHKLPWNECQHVKSHNKNLNGIRIEKQKLESGLMTAKITLRTQHDSLNNADPDALRHDRHVMELKT
jgi:hypothetical protein